MKEIVLGIDADNGDLDKDNNKPTKKICSAVLRFTKENPDTHLVLVGNETNIREALVKIPHNVSLVHAQVYSHPKEEVKFHAPGSSLNTLVNLASTNLIDAFFTIGSTQKFGAELGKLKRIPGVRKPALITTVPRYPSGELLLTDVGATSLNQNHKPDKLYSTAVEEFALDIYCQGIIAAVYSKERGVKIPKLGLVTVGEEEGKGSDWILRAHELFKEHSRNLEGFLYYVGKVEPADIIRDQRTALDVALADGPTGNIIIKTEGAVLGLVSDIVQDIKKNHLGLLGKLALAPAYFFLKHNKKVQEVRARYDKDVYNAALLAGRVKAVSKGHGNSTERAVYFGIKRASEFCSMDLSSKIEQALTDYMPK